MIDSARVIELWSTAGGVGTGYLVADDLVLTAAHAAAGDCEARPLGEPDWRAAEVVWRGDGCDAALLRIAPVQGNGSVRFGRMMAGTPAPCQAVGFPAAQVRDQVRDTEGLEGRLRPHSGLKGGLLTVDLTGSVPEADDSGRSPWAGMSGAALFSGPLLIGIIRVDPAHYGSDRLLAVPMSAIAAEPGFRKHMGRDVRLEAVEEALTDALRPRLKSVLEDHGVFGGREAELAKLDAFAARPDPGYLFVSAESGLGKTALLVHWLNGLIERDDGPSVAYTFINRRRDLAGEDFTLRNLAQQLGWLRGEFGPLPASTAEVRARYRKLLVERSGGQAVVVIIDGLDEASGWTPGDDLFPPPAAGTHVVFSAREIAGRTADDWLRDLGLGAEVERLPLDVLGREQLEQLLAGADGVPAWARGKPSLDAMLDVSGGDPFYLRFLVEDLQGGAIPTVEKLRERPTGLDGFFAQWWDQVSGSGLEQPVGDLLGYLLVSLGPMTADELAQVSDKDALSPFTVKKAIDDVLRFLVGDAEDGYALSHPRFQRYLAQPKGPLHGVVDTYGKAVLDWVATWRDHRSRYALAHVIDHLSQHERFADQLASLINDGDFHRAHAEVVDDLPRLQRDLELALEAIARAPAAPLLPVLRGALGLERFRADWLRPKTIFDLAASARLTEAERRLGLFDAPDRWRQIARLAILWIGSDTAPQQDVSELRSRVAAELGDWPPLPMLLERVEHQLGERPDEPELLLPYPPGSLPPAPEPWSAEVIVATMGGAADAEMQARGLEYITGATQSDVAVVYVAERDAPQLVAFAREQPDPGDELLARYISIHASNPYPEYRNRSLWAVLGAAACHPDPAVARDLVRALAEAALAPSPHAFREGLRLTLEALRARAGIVHRFDQLVHQATSNAEALQPPQQIDSWGNHTRRLAALAEVNSVALGRQPEAETLLATARGLPFGFAGYSSSAYLTLAEAHLVCSGGDVAAGRPGVVAARAAAHHIQEPPFCALRTARVNAMLARWWQGPIADLPALIERFAGSPQGAEFAPLHLVGEQFDEREISPAMMEIPDAARNAVTLREIAAEVYQLSLSALQQLQRDTPADDPLPPGTPVAVPDPGFPPVLAARLSAEALVAPGLTPEERAACIGRLVPLAADNPTAMHTVLARLLLAALPQDAAALDAIDAIAPQEWLQEPDAGDDPHRFGPA